MHKKKNAYEEFLCLMQTIFCTLFFFLLFFFIYLYKREMISRGSVFLKKDGL